MNPRLPFLAIALAGASLLATDASAQTLTTITEWNFNNNPVAVNTSPGHLDRHGHRFYPWHEHQQQHRRG